MQHAAGPGSKPPQTSVTNVSDDVRTRRLCSLRKKACRTNLHLLEVEQLRLAGLVGDVLNLVSEAAKHSAAASLVDVALVCAHVSAHLLQHLIACLSQAEVQSAPQSSPVGLYSLYRLPELTAPSEDACINAITASHMGRPTNFCLIANKAGTEDICV